MKAVLLVVWLVCERVVKSEQNKAVYWVERKELEWADQKAAKMAVYLVGMRAVDLAVLWAGGLVVLKVVQLVCSPAVCLVGLWGSYLVVPKVCCWAVLTAERLAPLKADWRVDLWVGNWLELN